MKRLMHSLMALAAGTIFGAGLVVSGMTRPTKVMGFLDVLGRWDPSLAFVMMGAIGVHVLAYALVKKRTSPLLGANFSIPTRRDVDVKLITGSVLFGVGWGLGGYCPGPGLVSLASGTSAILVFVGFMVAGMFGATKLEKLLARRDDVTAITRSDIPSKA